jgi:hypothetical protein
MVSASFAADRMDLSLGKGGDGRRLHIQLVGADANAPVSASARMAGQSNYLLGPDASHWHTHVPHFGRIVYSGIYPGIDLALYGNGQHLEHDFIVQPGADLSRIRMNYEGARSLSLDAAGVLHVSLGSGEVQLRAPTIYQVKDGKHTPRTGRFVLHGRQVSFAVAHVDHTAQLVIDPILDFATYLADQSLYVNGVAVDPVGNTYIVGETFSSAYPVTPGAAQSTCGSCPSTGDIFVTKLNPTGSAQIYSTYIGGNDNDQPYAIAVDSNGNAVVTGFTSSSDYPLKNSIGFASHPSQEAILTSLTPDGSAFNFSTGFDSSSLMTYAQALATDSSGNIYVSGSTNSSTFPITAGALHATTPDSSHTLLFLTKFQLSGSISFSGLVGELGSANGGVGAAGLAVDATNNVYLVGTAGSGFTNLGERTVSPWPVTPGAYQSQLLGSNDNAPLAAKISADGSTLVYSTLVGSGHAYAMALDASKQILLAGDAGDNFPTTSNAYSTTLVAATTNVFVARLSADATSLPYSSYLPPAISATGAAFDASGNLWLTGRAGRGLPLVNPIQSDPGTSFTSFITEFDPQIKTPLFSTYLNGPQGGTATVGIAIDAQGLIHTAGTTQDDLPTTPGAFLRSVTPAPPNYFYNYGFAALISPGDAAPGVCVHSGIPPVIQVGSTGQATFSITNCGNINLNITGIQLQTSGSLFSLVSASTCVGSLAVGATCTDTYNFTPSVAGNASATLLITSDANIPTQQATLTAVGTAPKIYLWESFITFSPQVLGAAGPTQTVALINQGTAPLIVNTAATTVSGPFTIASATCSSPIPPASSSSSGCTFILSYKPTKVGTDTGTLTIPSNDPFQPTATVALSGSTIASYPSPTVSQLMPSAVSLGSTTATLILNGTNFFPTSTVTVGGEPLSTVYLSATALQVKLDPSIFVAVGELPVVVTNPAPGGSSVSFALPVFRSLPISASALIYEPVSKLLFASIPSTAATNPNTVLPIDPLTGVAGTPISVGTNPGKLAASPDGSSLFVAVNGDHQLRRINLASRAIDRTFALPADAIGPTTIFDMHVVPGSPQNVVASLSHQASPGEAGAALFTDAGLASFVPSDFSHKYYALDNFTFTSDPTQLFGYPFGNTFFSTTQVNASTLTPVAPAGSCCTQSTGSIVASDGTLLFTNSGQVWNPKTQSLLGTFTSPGSPNDQLSYEPSVVPDATLSRTFILDTFINSDSILSFDPSTFKQVGITSIPEQAYPDASDLVRWGPDGFAFRVYDANYIPNTTDAIVLLHSSLAQTGSAPAPTLTSLSPATVAVGSPTFSITVNGSGFIPGSIVLWNGTARETVFNSATVLSALIPLSDLATAGTAQVTVMNSGGASAPRPFVILGPAFTLAPATLTFGSQNVGVASSPGAVTLTNSGAGALSMQGLAFPIAGSGDFTATSACPVSLATGSSCTLAVVFKPSSAAAASAVLTVTVPGLAAQTVALSGTGVAPDFTLADPTTTTSTVPAGGTATYSLSLASVNGFTGPIALACSNLPAYASCVFSPSSTTLSTSTPVSVSIVTTATKVALVAPPVLHATPDNRSLVYALLGLLGAPLFATRRIRRNLKRTRSLLLLLAGLGILGGVLGCGTKPSSSSTTSPATPSPGTPAGTYTVTVTATAGTMTHSIPLTLVVQ